MKKSPALVRAEVKLKKLMKEIVDTKKRIKELTAKGKKATAAAKAKAKSSAKRGRPAKKKQPLKRQQSAVVQLRKK